MAGGKTPFAGDHLTIGYQKHLGTGQPSIGVGLDHPPCCSLAHLAGALSKPVWVMTPKVAAWRYLNEGETMPWYPPVRLFRQTEAGDWVSVIESIRQQLLTRTTD